MNVEFIDYYRGVFLCRIDDSYSMWERDTNNLEEFDSEEEARDIFDKFKQKIIEDDCFIFDFDEIMKEVKPKRQWKIIIMEDDETQR